MTQRDLLLTLEREACRTRGARSRALRDAREKALLDPALSVADVDAAIARGARAGRILSAFQEHLARAGWDARAEELALSLRSLEGAASLAEDTWRDRLQALERELCHYGDDAPVRAALLTHQWAHVLPERRAELDAALRRGLLAAETWQQILDRLERGPQDPTVRALLQQARGWPAAFPAFDALIHALREPSEREPLRDRVAERVGQLLEEANRSAESAPVEEVVQGGGRRRRRRSRGGSRSGSGVANALPIDRGPRDAQLEDDTESTGGGAGRGRSGGRRVRARTPGYRVSASARPMLGGAQPPVAVWELPSSETFFVLIDETGSLFQAEVSEAHEADRGRTVAVAFGADQRPPSLPHGFHATEISASHRSRRLDRHMRDLFSRRTAVFGLSAGPWMQAAEESWHGLIMQTVGWTLRCLPIGETREVYVMVEERARAGAGVDWDAAQSLLHAQLTRADARWEQVRLIVRVVSKTHDPALGYADLVAYSWRTMYAFTPHAQPSRDRMDLYGLPGRHLLGSDLPSDWSMMSTWHDHPERLTTLEWTALLRYVSQYGVDSLFGYVLSRLLPVVRDRADIAASLVEYVSERVQGSGRDMHQIARELAWIRQSDLHFGDLRHQLVLATAELALDVAHAADTRAAEDTLLARSARLREEFPMLACQADLAVARARLMRSASPDGLAALAPWLGDEIGPGLRHRIRAACLAAQLEASQGGGKRAAAWLERASRLAVRLHGDLDRMQRVHSVRWLDALNALGTPGLSLVERRTRVEQLVLLNPTFVRAMACDDDPDMTDLHLLAVRWIAEHGDPALRQAYCAERRDWADGTGSRWAMIEWYRGWLLTDAAAGGVGGLGSEARERWELGIHLLRAMEMRTRVERLQEQLLLWAARAAGSRLEWAPDAELAEPLGRTARNGAQKVDWKTAQQLVHRWIPLGFG